jgi:hypothetical protein
MYRFHPNFFKAAASGIKFSSEAVLLMRSESDSESLMLVRGLFYLT